MRGVRYRGVLAFSLTVLAACDGTPQAPDPLNYSSIRPAQAASVYRLAVLPQHNPRKLMEAYQPLVDELNRQIEDANFELEASRNYQEFERKFRAREPSFLLPNPWQTLEAMKVGYEVIAMAGDPDDFKGIFIARRGGDIKTPRDLLGKGVSYPSPTALAGAIMPQFYLHSHGINVNEDIGNSYVGSHESAIMNVYLGKSAVGTTWPPPWRLFQQDHPTEAAALEVLWETPPLVNNSVMVRDDVPTAIRNHVAKVLMDLEQTPAGPKILEGMQTARFYDADEKSYDAVREYIARFEQEVRMVE